MQYKPEPVTIQFKTVSPIFVGSGEEVTPLSFLTDTKTLYVLDESKFFAALSPRDQEFYLNWIDPILENMNRANEEIQQAKKTKDNNTERQAKSRLNQLKGQLSVEEFFRSRIRANAVQFVQQKECVSYSVKMVARPGTNGYKACLKDAQNHPYLPGTEIKGALRTALLFAFLEEDINYRLLKEAIQNLAAITTRHLHKVKL